MQPFLPIILIRMMSKDNCIPEAVFFIVSVAALAAAVVCGGASKAQFIAAAMAAFAVTACLGIAARRSPDRIARISNRKPREIEREVLHAGNRR